MWFIEMDKFKVTFSQQSAKSDRCPGAQSKPRHLMRDDTGFGRAFRQRGILRGQQFNFIAALAQTQQRQQSLALPATPLALQVGEQDPHPRSPSPAARTSFPRFSYLMRTARAAICAIRAPLYPSRNPPRRK